MKIGGLLGHASGGGEKNQVSGQRRGTISVDRHTLTTNLPGVFAGGDAVTGPARVVDALAHGKRGAEEIDRYLAGKRGDRPYVEKLEKIMN